MTRTLINTLFLGTALLSASPALAEQVTLQFWDTRQSAIDLAKANIRVNSVAPGTIMTPMNEKIFEETEDAQGLIDSWNRAHPIGRFGQPMEVAELVAFLASDRASFITGEIVRCDGGLAIRGE